MKAPRIMLAAGRSGSGKTMITCGLLRALQQMGKQPAAFKCGPDYIDPMFHEQVIGAPSCNLDPFFTEEETTQYLFCKHAAGHDISVLEGVMGYYDGLGGISTKGSAYDLAGMTKTPVLLVVDAKGMSVSALAFIKGYLQYKEDSRIAGVIFNRMSEMLYREIAPMAEKELGISCVGFVPELKECHLESRHLGLVMPDEVENLQEQVNLLAETLQKTLDFEKILAIAEGAEELSGKMPEVLRKVTESEAAAKVRAAKPILAVAKDEAFCFFYRDNLELLASLGAKIEYFSPLSDAEPPKNTDGFMIKCRFLQNAAVICTCQNPWRIWMEMCILWYRLFREMFTGQKSWEDSAISPSRQTRRIPFGTAEIRCAAMSSITLTAQTAEVHGMRQNRCGSGTGNAFMRQNG